MASAVKKVELFACPKCSKNHASEQKAEKCLKACESTERRALIEKKREAMRQKIYDKVRLEAESLDDIEKLLIAYARKYLHLELKITRFPTRFGLVSNTHSAPIGKEMNWSGSSKLPFGYLGWSGQIEGQVRALDKWKPTSSDDEPDLYDVFGGSWGKKGFTGFNTGTGSYGSRFQGELRMFLDDFPKIKAKHERYEELVQKETQKNKFTAERASKSVELAEFAMSIDPKASELQERVENIDKQLSRLAAERMSLSTELIEIRKQHLSDSSRQIERKLPVPAEISYDESEYDALFETFKP